MPDQLTALMEQLADETVDTDLVSELPGRQRAHQRRVRLTATTLAILVAGGTGAGLGACLIGSQPVPHPVGATETRRTFHTGGRQHHVRGYVFWGEPTSPGEAGPAIWFKLTRSGATAVCGGVGGRMTDRRALLNPISGVCTAPALPSAGHNIGTDVPYSAAESSRIHGGVGDIFLVVSKDVATGGALLRNGHYAAGRVWRIPHAPARILNIAAKPYQIRSYLVRARNGTVLERESVRAP